MNNNKQILTPEQTKNWSKFIDITDRKEELQAVADSWTNRKAGTVGNGKITNQMNPKFVGLAGELVYARACGIEHELSLEYKPRGDGGVDFKRFQVDVKTVTWHRAADKILVENKDTNPEDRRTTDPAKLAKYFVAVKLNREQTGGWVCGWATKSRLLADNVRELFPGEGERYVLSEEELNPFGTDINYLFYLHKLSQHVYDTELAEIMLKQREQYWKQYHEAYQKEVKAGLI